MRVLHIVAQHEKFIASGVYRYTRDDVPLKGEEHFSIHELPDGSWFVRVDYDWRAVDGTSQLIEALVDSPANGGRFQRIVAQLHGPMGIVRETYDMHPTSVIVSTKNADNVRRDSEHPLPADYAVVLLKTTLLGIEVARWRAAPGVSVTAFGGYRSADDHVLSFDTVLREIGQDRITLGSVRYDARIVEMSGEFMQRLWIDPSGIVLRRELGELKVELHNYARRTGTST